MNLKLIIVWVFIPIGLFAQQTVTLQDCWNGAKVQLPLLQNTHAFAKLDSLEQLVLKTNYFPQLNVKAQATWQSDVTSLEIPISNITMEDPSKEQYKVYLEINQLIWDGGRTKTLRENSRAQYELSKAETNEAFYGVKERVASLYFALMLSQQQIMLTKELISTLENRLEELKSSVMHGIVREAGLYVLQAEKLQAEQSLSNQMLQANGVANMLNVLTGLEITVEWQLEKPLAVIPNQVNRSQLRVYDLQFQSAEFGMELLKKNRMPMISAFSQAGYGKPGMNMLKDEADSWLLIGAGVSWNIFDWNSSKRKQEKLQVQQEMIDNSREQFLYQISVDEKRITSEIQQFETALLKDDEIIVLRQKITQDCNSQLTQGTVTSSAYVEELYKELSAKISREINKIRLNQAQVALQILLEE